MDDKRVLVSVRVRPKLEFANAQLQQNEKYHVEAAAKTSDSSVRLSDGKTARDSKTHNFTFDMVFDKDSTQLDVYEETTLDAVDAVLQGNNATILTYGQTGSGKTYTVLGSVKKNPLTNDIITADTGLFLRALKDVLSFAEKRQDLHVVVGLSVLEIYLDDVRDLLSPEPMPPTLKVSVIGDTLSIPNMTYKSIRDLNDAVNAYKLANARRVSRATSANDTSSRSHAVFSIEIFQQPKTAANPEPCEAHKLCELREKVQLHLNTNGATADTPLSGTLSARTPLGASLSNGGSSFASPSSSSPAPLTPPAASPTVGGGDLLFGSRASNPLLNAPGQPPIMFSKLVLTDLAGSEKIKNSRVRGEGLEELKKINGSLTSLGNVVHSLYAGAKHIPYRDSKLTILLRESFAAPNSKIVLIANVSPTILTFDETLSTMFFADKVKGMKVENPQNAEVARMEVEFLNLTKVADELCTDLRIARESLDVVPVIRRFGAPQWVESRLGIVKRPLTKDKELRTLTDVSLQQGRKIAEERQAALAGELEAVRRATKDDVVEAHRRLRQQITTLLDQIVAEQERDARESREVAEDFDQEITSESLTLSQLESAHEELEPAHTRLPIAVREADVTIERLQSAIETMERKMFEKYKDAEADWETHSAIHVKQERQWASSTRFADSCLGLWKVKGQYMSLKQDNFRISSKAHNSRHQSETEDVTHWIRAAVGRMARNAVAMSISQRGRRVPSTRPASRSVNGRRVDPNDPQDDASTSTEVARQRGKRRGTLYDQPTLMGEIITYVQYGCMILKYGRSGAPHYRLFYVICDDATGTSRLCWDEEDDGQRLGKGSMVPLESVTRVILGQYTPTFKRIPGGEGFYNSFSLEYVSKQQFRTLDLVCDTDAELESWVIALCYLTKKNPTYLEPYHGLRMMPSFHLLSPAEAEVCASWHVQPETLLACKRRVEEVSVRTKSRPAKLTPGEIRMMSGIDIFRGCALWHHFRNEGLVENGVDRLYSYLSYND